MHHRHDVFCLSNQLLAGAAVQDVDGHKQTALHHAAATDQPSIISVLIENGILVDALDDNQNNGESLPDSYPCLQ